MDEAFLCFAWLVFITVWRILCQLPNFRTNVVNPIEGFFDLHNRCCGRFGHHFSRGTPILEWWFMAVVLLSIMLANNFWDIIRYEYVSYHRLLSTHAFNYTETIDANFDKGDFFHGNATTFDLRSMPMEELRRELDIPLWLRGIAMAAPAIGVVAYVLFVAHLVTFVLNFKQQKEAEANQQATERHLLMVGEPVEVKIDGEVKHGTVTVLDAGDPDGFPYKVKFEGEDGREDWFQADRVTKVPKQINPWVAERHEDLAILVIMMPAVFIVMAMKAEVRLLELMTGSAVHGDQTWSEYEAPLIALYTIDLELSAICQYVTVFAFAVLCFGFFNLNHIEKAIINRENHFYHKIVAFTQNESEEKRRQLTEPDGRNKEAVIQEIQRLSVEHSRTLQLAGLLGVWGYVVVGIARSMFGVIVAILLEFASLRDKVSAMQQQAMAVLTPIAGFSALLCFANMKLVLMMPDLTAETAFGASANFKFLACRLLLLLSDGQMGVLVALTKLSAYVQGFEFSIYHAKLVHVCLLEMECLAMVMFNSYMWKETVRTRSWNAAQMVRSIQTGVSKRGAAMKIMLRGTPVILGVAVPSLVLMLTLICGTVGGGGPVEHPPPSSLFDKLLRATGIFFTFVPFILSCWFLPNLDFLTARAEGFDWLPSGTFAWRTQQFVMLLHIIWVRWVVLCFVGPYHYYFSDHIFLVVSVMAAIMMELATATVAYKQHNGGATIVFVASLFFGLLLCSDMWATAKYYHTAQASWTAFFVGLLVFGFMALRWIWFIVSGEIAVKDEGGTNEAPLLGQ